MSDISTLTTAQAVIPPGLSRVEDGGIGSVRVVVTGELDIATMPEVDQVLRRLHARSELIVVDLRDVAFMDCSGAHVLRALHVRVRWAGGRLLVVCAPGPVERLLAMTGLDHELEVVHEPPPARDGDRWLVCDASARETGTVHFGVPATDPLATLEWRRASATTPRVTLRTAG